MAIKSKARHDLTLRSIKREIAAGRDVAYWLDRAYVHLDSGLLTEDDIAEVEALAQAYYDALDAEDCVDFLQAHPGAVTLADAHAALLRGETLSPAVLLPGENGGIVLAG